MKPASRLIRINKRNNMFAILAVVLSIAVFAVLCATQISRWSVWFDESFTHYLIKFNFLDIAKWTASDVHPPLFYWFLKIWGMIFGTSDVALRSMSMMFGSIVIVLAFILTRKLFGKKVGYLVLPLLALSPMLLRYSIEARMYTMVTTIVLAQVLVLLKARETSRKSWWILYGVLLAAGMWTHYFTAVAVLGQWVWLFIVSHKSWRTVFGFGHEQKITWRTFWRQIFGVKSGNFLQALIVAAVLFAPWLPIVCRQMATVTASGFWIPAIGLNTVPDFIAATFLYQTAATTTGWLAAGIMVLLVLAIYLFVKIWRANRDQRLRQNLQLVICLIVVPPLILLLASLPPLRSSFIDRYVLSVIILVSVLIAAIVGLSRQKITKTVLYILTLGAFVAGFCSLVYFGNCNKVTNNISTAKELMTQITAKSDQQTIPVIASSAWNFYDADVYATARNPVHFLASQVDNYYYGSERMLAVGPDKIDNLQTWITQKHINKIWYIAASGDANTPPAELGKSAKDWMKTREIDTAAPNGWNGSLEAVLYKIR